MTPEVNHVLSPDVTTEEPDHGEGTCVQPTTVNMEEVSKPVHQNERLQNVHGSHDEIHETSRGQNIPSETNERLSEPLQPVRRSMRGTVPRKMFSAKLTGKTHE